MAAAMDETQLEARIQAILVEMFELEPAQLRPQASLRGTLRLDSADLVDLVTRLETEFGLDPELDGYRNVSTIKELVGFVRAEMTKAAAGSST